MADSLTFKCAKSVTKHTGDEMLLVIPRRGGDTHQVKQWWGLKQTVLYKTCAVFKVSSTVGDLRLIIPTDRETTMLDIRHDGDGNFTFPTTRGIDRVAVFSEDMGTLYREYQFSRISGGATLTRTVTPYVAAAPAAAPPAPEPPAPEPPAQPTFAEKVAAATYTYTVTVDNGVYELDGVAQETVTASVGEGIVFDFSGVSGAHPLGIFTDAAKTTPVTVGVEEENGVLYFEPPIAGSFSYQCINHINMGGDITVS